MSIVILRKSTIVLKRASQASLRTMHLAGSLVAPDLTARHAARLMSTPFDTGRRHARDADDGGAQHKWIMIDGQRIATYHWGDPATQPCVLLAHGWSSHALRFLPWVRALRDAGHAVIGFDQHGHGRSGKGPNSLVGFIRTLSAIADSHGPFAAVIGHSMGATATMVALADGMVARRVVLVAPVADPGSVTLRFTRMMGMTPGIAPRIQHVLETQWGVSIRQLTAYLRVPALATPALIVHDLADAEVPWEDGESYARHWPGARLVSTSELGHNRIVNDPGTIDAGLRFLRGEVVGERVVSSPNLPFGVA